MDEIQEISICESEKVESPVVEYKNIECFTDEFRAMQLNGDVWGVYYQDGEVVCQDVWQEIHKNILL